MRAAFPFAYPAVKERVRELHPSVEAYEAPVSTGPPAQLFRKVAGPGIEPGGPAL
jgi:hypothetical protein